MDSALAGYDTLCASQVVRRLESLGPDELRAFSRYEASHRNRHTILNRAHQILDAIESCDGVVPPVGAVADLDAAETAARARRRRARRRRAQWGRHDTGNTAARSHGSGA